MNTTNFTKTFDNLQNLGREWARQALASSAKTFEATARYLDGLATRMNGENGAPVEQDTAVQAEKIKEEAEATKAS